MERRDGKGWILRRRGRRGRLERGKRLEKTAATLIEAPVNCLYGNYLTRSASLHFQALVDDSLGRWDSSTF